MNQHSSGLLASLLVLWVGACGPSGNPGSGPDAGDSLVPASPDSSPLNHNRPGEDGELETPEQAILRAETDPRVQAFRKRCTEKGFKVGSHAKFRPDQNQWIVVFYAEDVRDLFLEIHLSPEGKCLSTTEGE